MATKLKIVEELQWLSDRISTQVRTVGLGLLAITWGLLISQPQINGPIPDSVKKNLLIIGVLALSAIVCDFLQYLFAYLNNRLMLRKIENEKLDEANYDYGAINYRLRGLFFWLKQILLIVACIWFFVIIVPFVINVVANGETSM